MTFCVPIENHWCELLHLGREFECVSPLQVVPPEQRDVAGEGLPGEGAVVVAQAVQRLDLVVVNALGGGGGGEPLK